MSQLGDLDRAKDLLKRAERAFGPKEAVSRARCVVARAEIALVSRDLGWPVASLAAARAVLDLHGDVLNAGHARHLEIRRLVLVGCLDDAERALADLDPRPFPPQLRAAHELVVAGIAMRRLRTRVARGALARAQQAACYARIPGLRVEVENAARLLDVPAARLLARDTEQQLTLEDVETLLATDVLVVDACCYAVRHGHIGVSLATRPTMFVLARTLAQSWPMSVARDALVRQTFRAKEADESHRARLRVEIGRLRRELRVFADVTATKSGFALTPHGNRAIVVLAPPVDEPHAAVLALLADGETWSSSALALALDTSQHTVQRALEALAAAGKIQAFGSGRARCWIAPLPIGFTTSLLLPGPLPGC